MKKILVILTFLISTTSLFAFDMGSEIQLNNSWFSKTRTETETAFLGETLGYGGSIYGIDQLNDDLSLSFGVYFDPILRYTVNTELFFKHEYITLSFGPFFGAFNTWDEVLQPGLLLSLRFDLPGIAFIGIRAESTLGGSLVSNNDFIQEKSHMQVGFYVPNALCSLNLLSKSFTQNLESTIVDQSVQDYYFTAELFKKNTLYGIVLDFIYRSQKMSYTSTSTITHTLNSLVIGTEINFNLGSVGKFYVDLDSNLFTFPADDLSTITLTDPEYLFDLRTGVLLTF